MYQKFVTLYMDGAYESFKPATEFDVWYVYSDVQNVYEQRYACWDKDSNAYTDGTDVRSANHR